MRSESPSQFKPRNEKSADGSFDNFGQLRREMHTPVISTQRLLALLKKRMYPMVPLAIWPPVLAQDFAGQKCDRQSQFASHTFQNARGQQIRASAGTFVKVLQDLVNCSYSKPKKPRTHVRSRTLRNIRIDVGFRKLQHRLGFEHSRNLWCLFCCGERPRTRQGEAAEAPSISFQLWTTRTLQVSTSRGKTKTCSEAYLWSCKQNPCVL